MFRERQLHRGAVLEVRRDPKTSLLGRELHRIQRVVGERLGAREERAGGQAHQHEPDRERAHDVRRWRREDAQSEGSSPAAPGGPRELGEDTLPDARAALGFQDDERVGVETQRDPDHLADGIGELMQLTFAASHLLDRLIESLLALAPTHL